MPGKSDNKEAAMKQSKTKEKKTVPFFRQSIGAKLTIILITVLAITLTTIGIINACFLAPFYQYNKENRLKEAYLQIQELSS